jgi:hypothetical protein
MDSVAGKIVVGIGLLMMAHSAYSAMQCTLQKNLELEINETIF